MELTRAVLSEDPYADGNRQKQDEGVSLERAGPRRPYSTTAPHGGTIFSLWRDFSLPSDTELYRPRFCMRGLVFSAVEVARERPNRMLGAAETRVCLFVYTHAANCLLFDDPALPPRQKRQAEASRYVRQKSRSLPARPESAITPLATNFQVKGASGFPSKIGASGMTDAEWRLLEVGEEGDVEF